MGIIAALLGVPAFAAWPLVGAARGIERQETVALADLNVGAAHGGERQEIVAFVDVNVVPMDGERVLRGQTVLVQGDRIVRIGASDVVSAPHDTRVIDGRGQYLIPGLADMHSHLASLHSGQLTPELLEQMLLLYLLNGVTTIRGMASARAHLAIRDRIRSGELLGPHTFIASHALSRSTAPDPGTAARLVAEHAAAGYDMLKIYGGFGPAVYDAITTAARQHGITVTGHIDQEAGLHAALDARQSSIEHLDGMIQVVVREEVADAVRRGELTWEQAHEFVDDARLRSVAARFREAGVWSVPTLYIGEVTATSESGEQIAARHPELDHVPAELRRIWMEYIASLRRQQEQSGSTETGRRVRAEQRRRFLKALADAGAPLMLGVDAPAPFMVPGFSVHREMQLMVGAGLTPYQVLESATRNPGLYVRDELGRDDRFGTIEVGSRADLVLVRGNPLADITNAADVVGVMLAGMWLTAEELRARVAKMGEVRVH